MRYIHFAAPPMPYFVTSGNAIYRPGDRHRHRSGIGFFDLIVVEHGTLYMEALGGEYAVSGGGMLLIPSNTPHGGTRNCKGNTLFHWLHFDTARDISYADSPVLNRHRQTSNTVTVNNHDQCYDFALPVYQTLDDQQERTAIALMERMESISINKFTQSATTIPAASDVFEQQASFMQLLFQLTQRDDRAGVNNLAGAVMQYIRTHYMEKISLNDIAAEMNYHPTHVIRCMKLQYGVTPARAILDCRLQKACSLLDSSDLSVREVSELSGFSSAAYFCKVFRAHAGMPPQTYRTKGRKS